MESPKTSRIADIVHQYQSELLAEWVQTQLDDTLSRTRDLMRESELRAQCAEFLTLLRQAISQGNTANVMTGNWAEVRTMLSDISRSRALQGFTPSETATFVFSLKKPLFNRIGEAFKNDIDSLQLEIWNVTELLDQLGLLTLEAYQKAREEIIARQQEELMELSTPVVKLWDGILALPLIGTLDSARTQIVMESLLQKIVETGSEIAIVDITGVPTVDTLVAQHLIKTVTAARLMGAECIISGIRPQIAQTIVHLGVDLSDVITKANLADAFTVALRRSGVGLQRLKPVSSAI